MPSKSSQPIQVKPIRFASRARLFLPVPPSLSHHFSALELEISENKSNAWAIINRRGSEKSAGKTSNEESALENPFTLPNFHLGRKPPGNTLFLALSPSVSEPSSIGKQAEQNASSTA